MKLPPVVNEFENKEEIILRDYLAIERTRLANERTLLTYIRSSLYLLISGIAFIQVQGFGDLRWLGYLSMILSVSFIIVGVYRFHQLRNRLRLFLLENEKLKSTQV